MQICLSSLEQGRHVDSHPPDGVGLCQLISCLISGMAVMKKIKKFNISKTVPARQKKHRGVVNTTMVTPQCSERSFCLVKSEVIK